MLFITVCSRKCITRYSLPCNLIWIDWLPYRILTRRFDSLTYSQSMYVRRAFLNFGCPGVTTKMKTYLIRIIRDSPASSLQDAEKNCLDIANRLEKLDRDPSRASL